MTPDDAARPQPDDRQAILAWRKRERERLRQARLAPPAQWRAQASARIAKGLSEAIGGFSGKAISAYWPMQGEPDLRPWMDAINAGGGRALLPVVVEKGKPLVFRPWKSGDKLSKGVWNIPVPDTEETAVPDICIAPVLGFDAGNYRLGYGGGYFDRTLAAAQNDPLVIGIGYELQRIDTIFPLPHDIAMAMIVTEASAS